MFCRMFTVLVRITGIDMSITVFYFSGKYNKPYGELKMHIFHISV